MLLRLEQSHMPVSRSDSDRLCHGHISLLVHPKTLILDRLELPKDWLKNLANTFSAAAQKKGRLRPANLCRSWQVPLDKLVNLTSLTSWLVNLASCPSSNHLTSFIVKSSYQHKCRTLDLRVVLFHEMVNRLFRTEREFVETPWGGVGYFSNERRFSVQFTRHFIEFVVVETKRFVGSIPNMILTRHTWGQRSSRSAGGNAEH